MYAVEAAQAVGGVCQGYGPVAPVVPCGPVEPVGPVAPVAPPVRHQGAPHLDARRGQAVRAPPPGGHEAPPRLRPAAVHGLPARGCDPASGRSTFVVAGSATSRRRMSIASPSAVDVPVFPEPTDAIAALPLLAPDLPGHGLRQAILDGGFPQPVPGTGGADQAGLPHRSAPRLRNATAARLAERGLHAARNHGGDGPSDAGGGRAVYPGSTARKSSQTTSGTLRRWAPA